MNGSPDDWQLLTRIRDDTWAFQTLFEKHKDYVYRLARGFLVDPELADDAVQEVFIRLYRAKTPTYVRAQFRTWLYKVTLNTSRDLQRKHRRHQVHRAELNEASPGVSSDIGEAVDAWLDIESVVADLPERQREVLILRYFEGLSTKETAEILGCNEGTIKAHLHRATRALKATFK
ncbi:MAG: RNA polymerase sigma factor [Gammaproteobacteria bacterium]|nr:MAG: RNA polymerase sigma factor [Gammaproteobacteria bacterium]